MRTVIVELYELLRDNETGLYKDKHGNVIGFVHIDFSDLNKFVEIVGEDSFADGGLEVVMFSRSSICVELNDIIEGYGHDLSDYKNCFNESDWNDYFND